MIVALIELLVFSTIDLVLFATFLDKIPRRFFVSFNFTDNVDGSLSVIVTH